VQTSVKKLNELLEPRYRNGGTHTAPFKMGISCSMLSICVWRVWCWQRAFLIVGATPTTAYLYLLSS
jgi:hypothetical protein